MVIIIFLVIFLVAGMEFALDGREGVEEEVASVSHDGGTAGSDAVLSLKKQEPGEEIVDRVADLNSV